MQFFQRTLCSCTCYDSLLKRFDQSLELIDPTTLNGTLKRGRTWRLRRVCLAPLDATKASSLAIPLHLVMWYITWMINKCLMQFVSSRYLLNWWHKISCFVNSGNLWCLSWRHEMLWYRVNFLVLWKAWSFYFGF